MTSYTTTTFSSSPTSKPSTAARRVRANFARSAVFAEFGRAAFATDQANFVDRLPGDLPRPSPEARVR